MTSFQPKTVKNNNWTNIGILRVEVLAKQLLKILQTLEVGELIVPNYLRSVDALKD